VFGRSPSRHGQSAALRRRPLHCQDGFGPARAPAHRAGASCRRASAPPGSALGRWRSFSRGRLALIRQVDGARLCASAIACGSRQPREPDTPTVRISNAPRARTAGPRTTLLTPWHRLLQAARLACAGHVGPPFAPGAPLSQLAARHSSESFWMSAVGVSPSWTTTRYRNVSGLPTRIVTGCSAAMFGLSIHRPRELCQVLGGLSG
jgi:hypothetical protein